ncbi:MAG: hypothetical protein SGBAC_010556 [Bacillariaceae sp.]
MKRSMFSWALYGVLVIARILVGPILNGYVHPDELFQSGQEIWYGYPPIIAWEFEPQNALRSVLPPGVMTGIPLQVYGMLSGNTTEFSGREVLLVPRFACAIMSVLTVDWSIWSVISATKDEKPLPLPLLLLASAWPTMVLLNRPFSNSMETCFVALLVAAILPRKTRISIQTCVYIGMLCALGLFTRFTFVFFAIPVMLLFLHDLINTETEIRNAIKKIMATAIAFVIASFALILADTLFYSTDYYVSNQNFTLTSIQKLVVTPWNALMYNSKVSNLQEHGLHPRWTHGLVNMFILFGPLTLLGYWKIIDSNINWTQQNQQFTNEYSQQQHQQHQQHLSRTTKLASWMIVSGLGFLSLAPHQEPRFLLPLLVPLVLLASNVGDSAIWRKSRMVPVLAATVWIVFNVILFTLFGVLHQSGVVPSLLGLGQVMAHHQQNPPPAILYYHTYMPPSFLLRLAATSRAEDDTCVNSAEGKVEGYCATTTGTFGTLVDLNGSDWASLEQALNERLDCDDKEESSSTNSVVLVMPTMIQEPNSDKDNSWAFTPDGCEMPGTSYDCHLLTSHGNHLSTEDIPPFGGSLTQFYSNMALNVYAVSCTSDVND